MKVMIMSTVFLQGFFIACDIFMRVHYTMFDTCIELWLNVQVAISFSVWSIVICTQDMSSIDLLFYE